MTSSIVERVILVTTAILTAASVTQGKIKFTHVSAPVGGTRLSFTENNSIKIRPIQNDGIEASTRASTTHDISRREYCLTADKTPIGIPIRDTSRIEKNAKFIVTGNLFTISSDTKLPFR